MRTCKISTSFHSLTEMSPDRNVPRPKCPQTETAHTETARTESARSKSRVPVTV